MFKNLKNYNVNEVEQKILEFWEQNKIFEKSLKKPKNKIYSFYDGPPFASGKPHYGHILATTIKDTVTRFWTMMGFKVERRVGWDCHGLPVENLIEKELGLKNKHDIEAMGIEKFNHACRNVVFRSVDDFEKTIKRAGRWANYSNSYATLDNSYMESVWWVFKKLWDQGLVYKDFRVSPYCPRCGTPLSNFEVNQGYKDVEDASVYIKFKLAGVKDGEYFLVWTTTPWTLAGNVALAIGSDIKYVKISHQGEKLILAKERLAVLNGQYKILEEFKGKKIAGIKYEPLFPIAKLKNSELAYKVWEADFVSTKDGSGIVHIAPAFGEDDNELIKSKAKDLLNNFEILNTVKDDGTIKEGLIGEKMFVKKADPLIIEDLKKRKLLYKEEKFTHSYPFCWRCDTPLLYYPIESWYVAVTKIKKNLVANNKKIYWMPKHLKEGRFGNWLKDARDWAISRNRFWGAALPIWQCFFCKNQTAIGSIEELAELSPPAKNKYFLLRHGGADSNDLDILSSYPEKFDNSLTKKGKAQIEKTASLFKNKKIDLIFSSDVLRTKETSQIVSKELGLKVNFDERLREWNFGVLNGQPIEKLNQFYANDLDRFKKAPEKGENLTDVRKRMMDFVFDLEKKYKNKNILIVGHGDPLWLLESAGKGLSDEKAIESKNKKYLKNAEARKIEFLNLPRDKFGRLDLHRPYIDEINIKCKHCGKEAKRINEVFDCWFESGAMPYGQWHYPFENKKLVEKTFPADFIGEGLDQTRGWFYTLHVLATALTLKNVGLGKNKPAFKNVVVNGMILAENGQKLSKRLKNYTEPEVIFEKMGADAMRYFLLSSTPIGEDYRVSDRSIQETKSKVIDRFVNSYNFYELYANKKASRFTPHALNVLDRWILARLNETMVKSTEKMKAYDLTEAARAVAIFIDDLSNWFIRRSRRRLQKPDNTKDFNDASRILFYCLLNTSKIIAPFAPFVAEAVYKSLSSNVEFKAKESVHLEEWVKGDKKKIDKKLISAMEEIRKLASLALAKRAEAGVKVRQPLASLKLKIKNSPPKADQPLAEKFKISEDLLKILAEEINVKQVIYDEKIKNEIELDTKITPELKEEGIIRELVRMIQDLRQEAGLKPQDKVQLFVETEGNIKNILNNRSKELLKEVNAKSLDLKKSEKISAQIETYLDSNKIWLGIKKI